MFDLIELLAISIFIIFLLGGLWIYFYVLIFVVKSKRYKKYGAEFVKVVFTGFFSAFFFLIIIRIWEDIIISDINLFAKFIFTIFVVVFFSIFLIIGIFLYSNLCERLEK